MNDELALFQLVESNKRLTAATLAGGLIAATGRPWSIGEALALTNDIHFAMYPAPNHGAYQEWAKTKNSKLSTVQK